MPLQSGKIKLLLRFVSFICHSAEELCGLKKQRNVQNGHLQLLNIERML